jgi:hypothetical protein
MIDSFVETNAKLRTELLMRGQGARPDKTGGRWGTRLKTHQG